jgi:hypothetical protein
MWSVVTFDNTVLSILGISCLSERNPQHYHGIRDVLGALFHTALVQSYKYDGYAETYTEATLLPVGSWNTVVVRY